MQTRTNDNFSGTDQEIINFTRDSVSRDAFSRPFADFPSADRGTYTLRISGIIRWTKRCVVLEKQYGVLFLIQSCLFIFGSVIWFSLPTDPQPYALISLFAICSIWAFISYWSGKRLPIIVWIGLPIVVGSLCAQFETYRSHTTILDSSVTTTVTGKITRREIDHRGIWRYRLQVRETAEPQIKRFPEEIMVVARQKHDGFHTGQVIEGRARLSPPSGPVSVGGNDFAFGTYFAGIGATGFFYASPKLISGGQEIVCLEDILSCFDQKLYILRASIAERIRDVIGGDAGALSASIITDERRAISPKVMDALRQSGLAHIVAISGLNMALAAGIFFVGVRTLLSTSQYVAEAISIKKLSAALALIMTLAYFLISGFAVSAERAWIMMSVMLIAVILDRQAISLRNVAISALIITVVSPSEVMGASFQMSFAATLALVSVFGFWSRRERDDLESEVFKTNFVLRSIRSATLLIVATIFTSLIGGLATAPFSISYFNQYSPYGLIANLLAMPVMGLIVMPFALIGMLLMPFGTDAPFLYIMGFGIHLVIDIAIYVTTCCEEITIGRLPEWILPAIIALLTVSAILRTALALITILPISIIITLAIYFPREKPVMVVHESGDHLLVLNDEFIYSNRARPSDFIYSNWKKVFSLKNDPIKPELTKLTEAQGTKGGLDVTTQMHNLLDSAETSKRFKCVSGRFCILAFDPIGRIAQIYDPKLIGPACDIADIVLTPIQSRMTKCRSGARLFTGRTLRQTGTLEFYLDEDRPNGYKIMSALNGERRPWTIHRYYDWRSEEPKDTTTINDNDE